MTHKSAGEEGDADFGDGLVAVLPHAAVERVHVLGFTGEDAHRHAAGDHLAVGCEVGADAEECLAAAGMHAEAGDDFVEDHADVGLFGDLAKLLQELDGLERWMAALHGLDQNGGNFMRMGLDPFERFGSAVLEHRHVRDGIAREFPEPAGDDCGCPLRLNPLTSTSSNMP